MRCTILEIRKTAIALDEKELVEYAMGQAYEALMKELQKVIK